MNDYEALMRDRVEEFNRYAAQKALLKQAELANKARRSNTTIAAHLVRIVTIILTSLR